MNNSDFTGYGIVLRSAKSGETLLRGEVAAYDGTKHVVELNVPATLQLEDTHLNVLIFRETEAFSFRGTARRIAGDNNLEIALYHGEEKMERRHERYAMNAFALVQQVYRSGDSLPELAKTSLRILDISAAGLRFASLDPFFQIGDYVALQLFVHAELKVFYCTVVRYIGDLTGLHEYGCRLISKPEFDTFAPQSHL